MSQLIMKKHARFGFFDRMDMWANRKAEKMKNLTTVKKEETRYSFKPKIVPPIQLTIE